MRQFVCALLVTLFLTASAGAAQQPPIGQVAFFYLGASVDEDTAVYDDYAYYLNAISPWLEKQRLTVTAHDSAPVTVVLPTGQKLHFSRADLALDLGYILIRPNGRFQAHYGVQTGVDIQQSVREFFGVSEQ